MYYEGGWSETETDAEGLYLPGKRGGMKFIGPSAPSASVGCEIA